MRTPHINRLAAEGRRFTDAHAPHSVCTPTRYDLLATCAELLGQSLPAEAGEDSISFLHALLDRPPCHPVRNALISDSNQGLFALRQGRWKLIAGQGGGGIGWTPPPEPSAPQLFDLEADVGESRDISAQHPETVRRLTTLLEQARQSGRSREIFSSAIPDLERLGDRK